MTYAPRRQYQPFAFREGDHVFIMGYDGRREGAIERRFMDHTGSNLYIVRLGATLCRVMGEADLWPAGDDSAT